jgi:hypothetical protein
MWHPKQLLRGEIIDALYLGGFTTIQIEFLGWLSYNAAAINNSRNPVKAAHTILAKAEDSDSRMAKMLAVFVKKKRETVRPSHVEKHPTADSVFADLQRDIQDGLVRAEMLAHDYKDLTKGGISDGLDSITSDPELRQGTGRWEEVEQPVEGDEKEYPDE